MRPRFRSRGVWQEVWGLDARSTSQPSRRLIGQRDNCSNQVDPMGLNLLPHSDFRRGPWGRPGFCLRAESPDSRCKYLSFWPFAQQAAG
jgi:hypothetical protein